MANTSHSRRQRPDGCSLNYPFSGSLLSVLLAGLVVGCDSSATSLAPDEPEETIQQITVDAAAEWSPIRLGPPMEVASTAFLGQSTNWHLAFFATSVLSNGGEGGPGGIEVHCLCQNSDASDARIQALTAADADILFQAVGAGAIPTQSDAWKTEELNPVIQDWFSYDVTTHTVSPDPGAVWKLRLADGVGFAKLRITGIEGGGQGGPGRILLEYALQSTPGAPFGPVQELWVDAQPGAMAPVDLAGGAAPASGRWDVALQGWRIRVNGGVSGSGGVGAVRVDEPFHSIEDASDLNARLYRADGVTGGFSQGEVDRRWFRYNLQGNRQIWPTFNVYLVRDGDQVWKVQLLNYYGDDGSPRQITLRSALLEGGAGP